MDTILSFFRDTLSGTSYIIMVVVDIIFIFAIIGFLGERSLKKKQKDQSEMDSSSKTMAEIKQAASSITNAKVNPIVLESNNESQITPMVNVKVQDTVSNSPVVSSIPEVISSIDVSSNNGPQVPIEEIKASMPKATIVEPIPEIATNQTTIPTVEPTPIPEITVANEKEIIPTIISNEQIQMNKEETI